jgi:hypothetical protein
VQLTQLYLKMLREEVCWYIPYCSNSSADRDGNVEAQQQASKAK